MKDHAGKCVNMQHNEVSDYDHPASHNPSRFVYGEFHLRNRIREIEYIRRRVSLRVLYECSLIL